MQDKRFAITVVVVIVAFAMLTVGLHSLTQVTEEPAPAPGKEVYNWAPAPTFSVFYEGKLYDDPEAWSGIQTVPKNAECIGLLAEITDNPDSELECSLGEVGAQVFLWEENGAVYLGYEVEYPYDKRANTILIAGTPKNPEDSFIVVY